MTTALSTVYTILVPALDILCCLHLHRLNLSSFSSPIHHNYYHIYFVEYHWDCSRPAVISDPTLLGDIFIIPVYGTFLLWTLVNLRRGFGVGYFHVKPVPELIDADSAWDIFMSSQFLSLLTRIQRGIFSCQVGFWACRRRTNVGYFHTSQHVNIRDYKELFPVIGAALSSGHIYFGIYHTVYVS